MAGKVNEDYEMSSRQIPPVITGETKALFEWLEPLFEITPKDTPPGEPKREPDCMPDRIELCPMYGLDKLQKGPPLFNRPWKPMSSPVPSREALVALASEIYARARRHCSAVRLKQSYLVMAYSNIKGPEAYDTLPLDLVPGPKEYSEKELAGGLPASDDTDTVQHRFMRDMMAHMRWNQEQTAEVLGGAHKLQQEIIQDLRAENRQLWQDRREDKINAEKALSMAEERKTAREVAEAKIMVFNDVRDLVKGLIKGYGPQAIHFLTRGKVSAIVFGLRQFLDSMKQEQRTQLFGIWDEHDNCLQAGILDKDQVDLLVEIVEQKKEPAALKGFLLGLRPEQLQQIVTQEVLTQEQIDKLKDLSEQVGKEAEEAPVPDVKEAKEA